MKNDLIASGIITKTRVDQEKRETDGNDPAKWDASVDGDDDGGACENS